MTDIFKFITKWILMFIIMSILAFVLVRMMPISPVEILLNNLSLPSTEENIKAVEEKWGLDKPLITQYKVWFTNFIKGDWGHSYITKLDLKEEWAKRLPYSLIIGLGGLVLSSILSFFIGYLSAIKENGFWDRLSKGLSIFAQSVPIFILSILVIYGLGVKLQKVKFFTGNQKAGLFFGVLFSALTTVGLLSRIVKSHFIEEGNKTYILSYISRGYNPKTVLLTKGYRQPLYGLFSALIDKLSWVIGGTTVIEFAFSIPGISYFLVESMHSRDYLVIQSYIILMFLWMFFVHIIINLILKVLLRGGHNEE